MKRPRIESKSVPIKKIKLTMKLLTLYGIPIDANHLHERMAQITNLLEKDDQEFLQFWKLKFSSDVKSPTTYEEKHGEDEEYKSLENMEDKEMEIESMPDQLSDLMQHFTNVRVQSIYSKEKEAFLLYFQADWETDKLHIEEDEETMTNDWVQNELVDQDNTVLFSKLHTLGQLLQIPIADMKMIPRIAVHDTFLQKEEEEFD